VDRELEHYRLLTEDEMGMALKAGVVVLL